jgi:hypothetical protein
LADRRPDETQLNGTCGTCRTVRTGRHADASTIDVRLDVVDDGVGFDPSAGIAESGIATMGSFAALADADRSIGVVS